MQTVQIEDDVYAFLLRNTTRIGESASDILRRLLSIPAQGNGSRRVRSKSSIPMSHTDGGTDRAVREFLASAQFLAEPVVVGKWLHLLSWMHKRDPSAFEKVLAIKGRHRKYFARTKHELDESGTSVLPRPIPDSPYWVVTNNDTPKKRRIARNVMTVLGYTDPAIDAVISTLT